MKRRIKPELIQLNEKDLKKIRTYQYKKQKGICPILRQRISLHEAVLDHKHKKKADPIGVNGDGICRGVLHFQANVMEGKLVKMFVRYGLHKFIELPELLRNIADYIENPPMKPKYIHPNEKPKRKILNKNCFNKLKKAYKLKYPRRKVLAFPKSKTLTKPLVKAFEKCNIEIEYNK